MYPVATSCLREFKEIVSAVSMSSFSAKLNKVDQKSIFCAIFD